MICPRCGQPGEVGRYCGRCGLLLTGPSAASGPVRLDKPTQQIPAGPSGPQFAPVALPPPDPTTRYPDPGHPGAPGGPSVDRRVGRALVLVAVVVLVVLVVLAAGVAAFVSLRGGDSSSTAASPVAVPPSSTSASTSTPTTPPPATSTAVSTVVLTTTVAAATTAPTGLSDVAAQSITCNSGSFVLLASETDEAAFVRRVDEVRSAGQLPVGARWTRTSSGCGLFGNDGWVLWSGPFTTVADACTTRLAAPFDASVRGTVPGGSSSSCACVTQAGAPPVLYAGSARSQWTGELQRVLQLKLDYDVGELDSGTWGVFTPALADAVRRFQADKGLTVDGEVGAATWSALEAAAC